MFVLEAQSCFRIAGGPENSLVPYQKKKKRLNPQTYNEKTFVVQLFEYHKTHNSKKMRINVFIFKKFTMVPSLMGIMKKRQKVMLTF
jgi:hypothetical protein